MADRFAAALPLHATLATAELGRRPSRPPDHRAESAALGALAQALAETPERILETLVDVAMELSGAGTAGVSLLSEDDGQPRFVWPAIAGAWKHFVGRSMPRDDSPCGVVVERDAVQLFVNPERRYDALPTDPPVVEALLAPFHARGKAVGTVWLVFHDDRRRFDSEDMRQLASLGCFASAAWQTWAALEACEQQGAALRRSEERYRSLTRALTSVVWTTDAAGCFVTPQPTWSEYTGQKGDEQHGMGWLAAFHPDDREGMRKGWAAACRAMQPCSGQARLWHAPSGRYRRVEARAVPIAGEDGSVREWVGTTLDVQDRAQALAEVAQQRQDLASFIDRSPLPMAVMRGDALVFEQVNAAYQSVVGGRDVVGRPLLEALPEVEGQGFEPLLRKVLRTGEPASGNEMPLLLERNGEVQETYWTFVLSPLHDADGSTQRVVALCSNVTEQRRLMDALKEGDRRKDEFLAMLAHELRNPLAPIRNASSLLRLTAETEEALEAHRMMERQLGHMVRLIDDLVDVSRVSRGKIELRRERLDLGAIVAHAVDAARKACEGKDVALALSLPGAPIHVDGDATRLTQVVDNLLSNARKFTHGGGRIEVAVAREAGCAVLRVRDDGIGIARQQIPYIFELFTQVETSLHRSEGGLGIGLALSKRLVEMHGGSVEVQSDGPGRGTAIAVRLPEAAEAQAPGAREPAPAREAAATCRILVVDDNRDAADSLALLLQLGGHDVFTAYDGEEALAVAVERRPDVVLLDIGLPKMDGYEVARRLRSEPQGSNPMLVAITGWGQQEDRRRSEAAGFDAHLVKPVDASALNGLLAGRSGAG